MNNSNNKWIYILLLVLIIITTVNLWLSKSRSIENADINLQRDSVLQFKIDSVMQSVNDFRRLYGNDRLISYDEQKISNNNNSLKKKKDELLKNNSDSVYNWTKHMLNTRTE